MTALSVVLALGACRDQPDSGLDEGSGEDEATQTGSSDDSPIEDMAGDPPLVPNPGYPHLFVRPEHKPIVLDRIEREPYTSVLAALHERIDIEPEQRPDPNMWHLDTELHNAMIVRGAAFLAWLDDDADYAAIAIERLDAFEADLDTAPITDSNIRMLHITYAHTDAIDLLLGPGYIDEATAEVYAQKMFDLCAQIHEMFIVNDIARMLYMTPAQNNHPIRTALALAYVANAYPDETADEPWRHWALSELDYLLGPKGHYMTADGAVSEGPLYHQFGFAASYNFYLSMSMTGNDDMIVVRDCINRNDADPWSDHGCVEGEEFTFTNAFDYEPFLAGMDWQLGLRMPSGHSPPFEDARLRYISGPALLTSIGGGGEFLWAWLNSGDSLPMTGGVEAIAHHLVHVDDSVAPVEPAFESVVFAEGGNAVLRSGWDADARWLMLLAEHGDVRKTLHDHVDGLSFQLAAYGEYLLIDPGYYKPNPLNNAVTAHSWAHNVLLIDGRSAPDKGIFEDFGDADAFLGLSHDGEALDYAEAWQEYQDTRVDRAVVMVDERYFVVADQLTTTSVDVREHAFRVNGYAGFDSGGSFELLGGEGGRWQRELAGVDVYLGSTSPGLSLLEPAYVEGAAPHVHEITSGHGHHAVLDGVVNDLSPGFLAVLAPYRVGAEPDAADATLLVEPIDLGPGAAAWTVTGADFIDLVLSREPDTPGPFLLPDDRLLTTDARLVVWRMQGSELALLSRGSSLQVDDLTVIDGGDSDGITVWEG